MKYYIEYVNDADFVTDTLRYRRDPVTGRVDFYDDRTNIMRLGNEWYQDTLAWANIDNKGFVLGDEPYDSVENPNGIGSPLPVTLASDAVPQRYNISTIRIYFPRFAVETYERGVKYALGISTWIHGAEVVMGQYLIDRNDAIAAENVKRFANEEYYEYIEVQIIDPWYLTYSDDWRLFRQAVCGEEYDESGYEYNTTGSVLNISLHPVSKTNIDKHYLENHEVDVYTEMDDYHGGQNAINLADESSDYLDFRIGDNHNITNYYESRMLIGTELSFNKSYKQDDDGLRDYLHETYRIGEYELIMEIVVQDNENVYSYMRKQVESPWQEFDVKELCDENGNYPLQFDSWKGFKEGMFLNIILNIIDSSNPETSIYLKSNQIALTYDLFRYLVTDHANFVVDKLEPKVYLEDNEITIDGTVINYGDVIVNGDNALVFLDNTRININDNTITYGNISIRKSDGVLLINGHPQNFSEYDVNNIVSYGKLTLTRITMKDDICTVTFEYVTPLKTTTLTISDYSIRWGNLFVEIGHIYNEETEETTYNIAKAEIGENVFYFNTNKNYTTFGGLVISIVDGVLTWGGTIRTPHNDIIRINKVGLDKIYLEAVDMKVYNINAVNKIQQNIIKMDRPDDYKANIIKPIFFRTHELGKLIVHPEVIEQVCINLDQYKSKVDSFVLKIEGVVFTEYARNNAGIIFRIVGPSLPGKMSPGTYYILNQDSELVTTGQYIYEK